MGVLIGRLIDRRGPRPILVAGALLLGAGTTALGFASEPWHVYPGFLLLGSGYACLHTVTLGAIISRWFVRAARPRDGRRDVRRQRRRDDPGAAERAAAGAALAPGRRVTLAAIAIVLVVPLAIWVVKDGPESVGQADRRRRSEGQGLARPTTLVARGRPIIAATSGTGRSAEAARTVAFWAIAVCFHLTMMAQGGFLVHQVLILPADLWVRGGGDGCERHDDHGRGRADGVHRDRGSLAAAPDRGRDVRAPGARDGASRRWADREPGCWSPARSPSALTMGIIVSIQPLVAADCFGRRAFGRVYGPIYLAIQLGTGFGSLVFGLTATAFGKLRAGPGDGRRYAAAGRVRDALGRPPRRDAGLLPSPPGHSAARCRR